MTDQLIPEKDYLHWQRRWQFSLASIFVVTTVFAGVCSLCRILGTELILAAVIIPAPFLFILFSLTYPPRDAQVVITLGAHTDPHLCRAHLCAHGVNAQVLAEPIADLPAALQPDPQIAVRGAQLGAARKLLADLREHGHTGTKPDRTRDNGPSIGHNNRG